MKRHVFAATALLFLVTLACRNRAPTKTYDAATPVATVAPTATSNEAEDNELVTKKMKTIDTIAATKLPPVTSISTLKPKGPKPKLEGFDYPVNAAAVDAKTIPAFAKVESFESTALFACSKLARGTVTTIDDLPRRTCKGYRYLVVVRFSTRVNPKMTGPTTYQGGHASGDATVFDLDTGERLGAVPFSAVNYDKLEAAQGLELWRVVADLEHQCLTVVNEAIDKAWPS